MSSDWEDDEPVGYGRPPKWSRFRQGRSGNPKGRPKKKRAATEQTSMGQSAYDDALRAEFAEMVTISTPHGPKQIPKAVAVTKAQFVAAIKGNALALRDLAREQQALEARDLRRAEEAHQEELRRQEAERDAYQRMAKYRANQAKLWGEAEALGREPDDPWPHPDDILLDPAQHTYRVRGPADEDGLPFFEWVRAERNVLFIKAYLDQFPTGRDLSGLDKMMITLWVSFDVMLPLRWQLNCNQDDPLWGLPFKADAQVRDLFENYKAQANRLRPRFQRPEHLKDSYRFANSIMKPLLKRHGYRSLAQFERAWEDTGGNPPWPRRSE